MKNEMMNELNIEEMDRVNGGRNIFDIIKDVVTKKDKNDNYIVLEGLKTIKDGICNKVKETYNTITEKINQVMEPLNPKPYHTERYDLTLGGND